MEKIECYQVEYAPDYFDDIKKHQKSGQKLLLKKIASFLLEIQIHPTTGTGQVEPLKGYKERTIYSRRIDQKHRLVYEIFEQEKKVKILSAYGHYDEE